VASLARVEHPARLAPAVAAERRKSVRDSVVVTLGGQLERALGTLVALTLRWGLDPSRMGIYTDLRLFLDNTNRSSLGVGLGAIQEIPILRAAGREEEARRIADVAHTTNTLTCLVYAVGLLAWSWFHAASLSGDPLAREWVWGMAAVAGLALIKRYESFLIAVLRAHQEFVLTTELDVFESLVSIVAVALGLALAGFFGLLASVGVVSMLKIAFLHARHPLRFRWAWDFPLTVRLMRLGLPILANTAAFGALLNLDRVLITWHIPDGVHALGLYSIAIMGTSWSLDLAGRLVLVMYTSFQTTLGRTRDIAVVARQAAAAIEAQAPLLAAGSAVAYVVGPAFLGLVIPHRYAPGLGALGPLLPGMFCLGLVWPARQMLIAIEHPFRLFLATMFGFGVTALSATVGADRGGIVGVAWGMSLGYGLTALATSATALAANLGWPCWIAHFGRLARTTVWYALGAFVAGHVPLPQLRPWTATSARYAVLAAWLVPSLWIWGRAHRWGGFLDRGRA
jgi:O-antigen/teichoic acid export membrane protein